MPRRLDPLANAPLAAVLLGTLYACGGGGGSSSVTGDRAAPTATLDFPPFGAATDADTMTVRGSAEDGSGVATVAVNGTPAASVDGFATFTAAVALATGDDVLGIEAVDSRGNRSPPTAAGLVRRVRHYTFIGAPAFDGSRLLMIDDARGALLEVDPVDGGTAIVSGAQVGLGVALGTVETLAIDAARGRALTGDSAAHALVAIDLGSGDRTPLSDALHGTGPLFSFFQGLAVDATKDAILVSDFGLNAILTVDLADGDRTILSDATHGTGPALERVGGVALDVPRDRLLVVSDDSGLNLGSLLAIDPATGNRTLVSGPGRGSGPAFSVPFSVAADASLNAALVFDFDPPTLFAVDLTSGDRTEISGPNRGAGVALDGGQVTLDLVRDRLLVASPKHLGLLAVDLASGNRTLVGEPIEVGSGPTFVFPADIDVDPELGLAAVADSNGEALIAIDLKDGSRRVIADALRGSGPVLKSPRAVAIDAANSRVLVEDIALGALLSVDLDTGDRTIVSDRNHGSGPTLDFGEHIALDATNARVLWLGSTELPDLDALLAISLATGDRTVISSKVRGTGPSLSSMEGLALDAAGNRALVVDFQDVIAIDLATGDRTVIVDPDGGGDFLSGDDVALDPSGARAIVLSFHFDETTLVAVDLATGERTTLTSPDLGVGPRFLFPLCLAVDPATGTALVADQSLKGAFAIDLSSGDRVIQTR